MNVRIELEKQIEHLQNELDKEKEMNIHKDKVQEIEYRKKMEENEALIKEMTKIKKINIEMSNQIKNLKYKNITLSQTVERFKVSKKNKLAELSALIDIVAPNVLHMIIPLSSAAVNINEPLSIALPFLANISAYPEPGAILDA
jgi:hypothetical protein